MLVKRLIQFRLLDPNTGSAGGDGGQGNGSGEGGAGEVTFTDAQQEKVNSIVQERLATESAKWQEQSKSQTQEAIKSAIEDYKKQAGMTDEQKAAAAQDEKDKQLAEMQHKLDSRDRLDHAHSAVAKAGLPDSFARYFVSDTDEGTDNNLAEISKEWKSQVQAAVEEQLKGKQTPGAGGQFAGKDDSLGKRLAERFGDSKPKNTYF